jgi:hypothetical protein
MVCSTRENEVLRNGHLRPRGSRKLPDRARRNLSQASRIAAVSGKLRLRPFVQFPNRKASVDHDASIEQRNDGIDLDVVLVWISPTICSIRSSSVAMPFHASVFIHDMPRCVLRALKHLTELLSFGGIWNKDGFPQELRQPKGFGDSAGKASILTVQNYRQRCRGRPGRPGNANTGVFTPDRISSKGVPIFERGHFQPRHHDVLDLTFEIQGPRSSIFMRSWRLPVISARSSASVAELVSGGGIRA